MKRGWGEGGGGGGGGGVGGGSEREKIGNKQGERGVAVIWGGGGANKTFGGTRDFCGGAKLLSPL